MRLSIIVAMSDNRVIGRDGGLPWHLSEDLKRFKRLTMAHHIVMGRRTFQSIGRPLPGRISVVLTRDQDFQAEGVRVARNLDEAIGVATADDEVFVIGGAAIYRAALPRADRLYVTQIHAEVKGDVVFPRLDWNSWTLIEDDPQGTGENDNFAYSFRIYERNQGKQA